MLLDLESHKLWYASEGAQSAAPLLLIHGVGNWADDWLGVVAELTDAFRIVRHDLRGHGRSSIPPGHWTIDDLADDAIALLNHLQLDRVHVAGFSLGGLVAQRMAVRFPERIDRLAILSSVAGRSAQERAAVAERLTFIAASHPSDYFEQSVDRWFTPSFREANPDLVAQKKAVISRMDREAYVKAYRILATTDLVDDLPRIIVPTMVMTGEHDRGSNPRMAALMHEQIPNSELVVLAGLRHSICLEAPEQVAAHLRAWFAGDAPKTAARDREAPR